MAAALPSNIQEFNVIAGLIFAQLYRLFPVRIDSIDRGVIAEAIGVPVGVDHSVFPLSSGRPFGEVLDSTIRWLAEENFINFFGPRPGDRATLTAKGLTVLNAVPDGLKETAGTQIAKAADRGYRFRLTPMGDLVGGIIGGITKSLTSG